MAVRTFPDPRPQPTSPARRPGALPRHRGGGGVGRPRRAPRRQAGPRLSGARTCRRAGLAGGRLKRSPRPATPAAAQSPPPGQPSDGAVPGLCAAPSSPRRWLPAPSPAGAQLPVSEALKVSRPLCPGRGGRGVLGLRGGRPAWRYCPMRTPGAAEPFPSTPPPRLPALKY